MTIYQLEHAIRAACSVLNTPEIYVVGSQSILGKYPKVSGVISDSLEADLLPIIEIIPNIKSEQEAADVINANFGYGSEFQRTHKFEIEGVVRIDLILPKNWKERTITVCNENTCGKKGHCLEPHDMAVAKLAAGRDKDKNAILNLIKQGIIKIPVLKKRINTLEGLTPDLLTPQNLIERLDRWCKSQKGNDNHEMM
jgi:hypothetical protein